MKSGHQRRAWLAWAVLCAGLCVTTAHAQSPVVCAGLDDTELLARIRGQTRDLPVVLIPAASVRVPRPTASDLQAVASEYQAEFVVTVDQEPSGARSVYVYDARASELRVRSAPAPERRRFARSAAAETVALIVRGELSDALSARASESKNTTPSRASDAGTAAGGARTASAPAAENDAPPRVATAPAPKNDAPPRVATAPKPAVQASAAVASEPRGETEEEPEVSRAAEGPPFSLGPPQLSLELAARFSSAVAGRYFFAAALTLRLSFDYFSLGITGSSTLADRAERQGLTLTLREHGIGVDALAHVPLSASFRVGLGATGRWLFYRRNAASGDPDWQPEPAGTASSFAVGPQLELRWQLAQHLGVGIRIGLDVLLHPVSWRYRLDTNPRVPIELEGQNRVAPWLSLGVYGSL